VAVEWPGLGVMEAPMEEGILKEQNTRYKVRLVISRPITVKEVCVGFAKWLTG
jgi:hypothetical protein